eukprot:TRINITY_DN5256_c0_g1_i5.p1 TRINITY_DN5256_c0_g1~~TRINITY_DN5256_c0_g1_i5.p1  ORF type:complete len:211 (-),score=52.78 TRINITY_DN5256_c0_g1_i5:249-881(-)
MPMEDVKENGERTQHGYSVVQVVLGAIMLTIGHKYLPPAVADDSAADAVIAGESGALDQQNVDPCPNGAAYFLYVSGIVLLVMNLIHVLSRVAQYLAERDGHISCGEACGLALLKFGSGIMAIADLVILIWGSVVVFGAWAHWTDDYEEYVQDINKMNYCAYEPMMYAFVILILKWVLIPCLVVLICCCGCLFPCLCACCIAACGDKGRV